ncbi:MAG: PQQ-binding-like beta-propeller repeat protein [Acidobacteria bacterium]|nr:PQQ-binding-like beta-propeller repeat protein [Acidobacteriota bacterium]
MYASRRSLFAGLLGAAFGRAADWPEWRGSGRVGVWSEDGLLERFPSGGLRVLWRTPVRAGYSAPSVAAGRVFVTDFEAGEGLKGVERALACDERTGAVLWQRSWPADYAGIDYASGPRAAPTVDAERVYVLGAEGRLACLSAETGDELWSTDFKRSFGTELPAWGMSSAPIVAGELLIAVAAGRPDAKVVAFDKRTGAIAWRALSSADSGPGYSQPLLIDVAGRPQLIVWHAGAVTALDPATGETLWNDPFPIMMETPIATPVWSPPYLLVSAFFNGSRLYRVGPQSAEVVWSSDTDNALENDGLHALMGSPVIDGGYIYGVSSYGQLRCLSLATGKLQWETQAVTVEKARNASAFIVREGGRYWINNDRGELILARLSPSGYEEIDRTKLIAPTSKPGARRQLGAVHWSHPAYANGRIFVRNDEELLCADLRSSS